MRDRIIQVISSALVALAFATAGHTAPASEEPSHTHEVIAPGAPLPGESIYQLRLQLTDQDGRHVTLDALRGRPALVTMFYSSCNGVCPLLAFTLRRMVTALPEAQRSGLGVLMVSFDPERDTQQALKAFAQLHQIDEPHWLLARASESEVRELAAVLGIRYREVQAGIYSHSAVITLLDREGVIRARTTALNELDPDFMRAVRVALE